VRVSLALHTSDLARRASEPCASSSTEITTSLELHTGSDAQRAIGSSGAKSEENCVGSGHRTKLVATNKTRTSWETVVFSGSSKPKLFADGVGVEPSEAVSANSTPLSSSGCACVSQEEVDVALVVAKSTDEGDLSGLCLSRSHSMLDLGQLERGGESIVDRRHDRLR